MRPTTILAPDPFLNFSSWHLRLPGTAFFVVGSQISSGQESRVVLLTQLAFLRAGENNPDSPAFARVRARLLASGRDVYGLFASEHGCARQRWISETPFVSAEFSEQGKRVHFFYNRAAVALIVCGNGIAIRDPKFVDLGTAEWYRRGRSLPASRTACC
ncbi:MAG: hypothetical protein HY644_02470 [Acidobacteria bacterium]|nr:hypothetical protein [Acidobacteriota bacterium]